MNKRNSRDFPRLFLFLPQRCSYAMKKQLVASPPYTQASPQQREVARLCRDGGIVQNMLPIE